MTTPTPTPSGTAWSRAAPAYAALIDATDALNPAGAACREILNLVATELPLDSASFILDMGTGSGPVISALLDAPAHAARIPTGARIVAADVAEGLLAILRERRREREGEEGVWRRLEVQEWDARDLSREIGDGEVSHLLSSYAYFAFAEEEKALAEAYRVLAAGGLFVETSMGWTEWGHLPTFFSGVRPDKAIPGPGSHWQSVEGVRRTLERVGFKDVGVREYGIGIAVPSAEAAVEMVFGAFPWVEGFVADMSAEEVRRAREAMAAWVRERHRGEEKILLRGTGLIGWGRK